MCVQTYERGAMQAVYARYRDLKKDIRNLAAVDMQRCARGYIVRSKSLSDLASKALTAKKSDAARAPQESPAVLFQPSVRSGPPMTSSAHAAAGEDLYGRYKELLNSKRDLKKRLKRFDEEFVEQWGRQPKKADKEVIRPMYQKYHEVTVCVCREASAPC